MRIYFMSICGTGMGNAALLFKAMGHDVIGADQNVYPPMSDALRVAGIEILQGFDAERLQQLAPELVVVGNVNTRGNPEIEWLLASRALPFVSLPEALNRMVLSRRRNIVVAGTHGKTTTTCLAAYLLRANGRDPGYLVGGVPHDLPHGAHPGAAADPFVIEGDEYDSAFFDKRSKFIHYQPSVLVLNNLEFDHADIFRDLADIQKTFNHLVRIVPNNGYIVANADDPNLAPIIDINWTPVLRVGVARDADVRIVNFAEDADGCRFELQPYGGPARPVRMCLWGFYNARNAAMAAIASSLALNPADPLGLDLTALADFRGVRRRQELLHDAGGTTVISDFAHHPTAIRETLASMRRRFPGRSIRACFEARSNTACRKIHEDAFRDALALADHVDFGAVFRAERYRDDDRIDLAGMAAQIGPRAICHGDNRILAAAVTDALRKQPEQVVVFFSNGSFDGAIQSVVAALSRPA